MKYLQPKNSTAFWIIRFGGSVPQKQLCFIVDFKFYIRFKKGSDAPVLLYQKNYYRGFHRIIFNDLILYNILVTQTKKTVTCLIPKFNAQYYVLPNGRYRCILWWHFSDIAYWYFSLTNEIRASTVITINAIKAYLILTLFEHNIFEQIRFITHDIWL